MIAGAARTKRFFRRLRGIAKDEDNRPKSPPKKTFPSGLKLLCGPSNGTIDIVFIHGLTGDRDATWTAHGAAEPWPKTLLPEILPTARVLTFGYDAYVADWRRVVSQSFIANHAFNLLASLSSYRENDGTNERPIIFVCHSLGGLVCEDALFTSKQRHEPHLHNILRSTRGIIFLGTPHHGASLAKWAEIVSRSIGLFKQTNPDIVDVLKRDSEVLARIQHGFHTMIKAQSIVDPPPIEVTCFYEELPVLGIGLVVPQESAILPGYIPIGIHSNHMDMSRFINVEDPGFVAVCGELRRWTRDTNMTQGCHANLSHTEQTGLVSQNGDNSQQYNQFGDGTQKNVQGSYFEAKGDQNFGTVPLK